MSFGKDMCYVCRVAAEFHENELRSTLIQDVSCEEAPRCRDSGGSSGSFLVLFFENASSKQ